MPDHPFSNGAHVPGQAEIERLPRWARVAFAARCARRVLSVLQAREAVSREQKGVVESAVELAERTAAHARACEGTADAAAAANVVASEVAADTVAFGAAVAASLAAAFAVQAADIAVAAEAVTRAAEAAPSLAAITADFRVLQQSALREGWTDGTPVPPAFFGPLWPNGLPPGWPQAGEVEVGTPEWDRLTQRRADLIVKEDEQGLTPAEQEEYDRLLQISRRAIERRFPRPDPESLADRISAANPPA